ncbi:MAG: preprotein translocase subunit YajC [Euzebyales bacterium]|nr:preprotein translocase subunit YajC [Euzebyales bacterium]
MHVIAPLAQAQQPGGSGISLLLPLVLIVVFYFLLIRPQRARAKSHQQLIASIGTGDRIATVGGMHGTVESIDDETVRLEVAPGTVVTMLRGSVARRIVEADTGAPGVE